MFKRFFGLVLILAVSGVQLPVFAQNLDSSSSASSSSLSSVSSSSGSSSSSSSSLSSSVSITQSASSSNSVESVKRIESLGIPNSSDSQQIVVKLKSAKTNKEIENSLKEKVGTGLLPITTSGVNETTSPSDLLVFNVKQGEDVKSAISKFEKLGDVEYAQPNYKYSTLSTNPTQNPSYNSKQWYLKNSNINPYGISAASAWQNLNTTLGSGNSGGLSSVKIAVIDSGVNTSLADFAGLNVVNPATIFGKSTSCTGVGETFLAGPFLDGSTTVYICKTNTQFDDDGHGTAVASIISAQDNTVSGVGIAHKTSLMPIALHGYGFTTYGISQAIKHAVANGAKVINLSLGTTFQDTALSTEINNAYNAGITVVAASGNCGNRLGQQPGCFTFLEPGDPGYNVLNPVVYPAAYDNVISVGAINPDGTRASYSTYNSQVDLVAPVGSGNTAGNATMTLCGLGNNSVAPTPIAWDADANRDRHPCFGIPTGSEVYEVGTSFAAPQVAAAVGLLLSKKSNLNIQQIYQIVSESSVDLGFPNKDSFFGYGLLNITQLISQPYFTNWVTDSSATTNLPYQISSFNNKFYQSYIGLNNRIYTRSTASTNINELPASGWSSWQTSMDASEFTSLEVTMAPFNITNKIYHTHIGRAETDGRQKIYTRSSSDGINWTGWTKGNDQLEDTKLPIGMTEFQGRLYQVHVGTPEPDGRQKIYTRSSSDGINWTGWTKGNDQLEDTKLPVKLTSFNSRLYQVHVGTPEPDGRQKIYTRSSSDGINWTGWTKGNDQLEDTKSTVEITSLDNFLYEVHKGTNNRIYTRKSIDGLNWQSWSDNGGSTTLPISMTIFNNFVYQGSVQNNNLYWRSLVK